MNMIPSPLTLDLTDTRAFKTWLYQLWQSTGGTTSTAIEDIDVYLATPAIDVINGSQLDQVLLTQIRDELASINKRLEETQTTDRVVVDEINQKFDELQKMERLDGTILDGVNKRFDELYINERQTIDKVNKKFDEIQVMNRTVVDEVNNKLDELQTRDRSVIDELSRKIDDIVLLLGVVA
jgi:hypothetical protein